MGLRVGRGSVATKVAAVALLLMVPGSFVVACSGSDGGSSTTDDDGGQASSSSGTSGASSTSGSSGTPVDGAPGCTTVGPKVATSATSNPRGTGTSAAWQSPENAFAQDDKRVTATLSTDVPSTDELHLTGFGFAIPSGSRVVGVDVALRRQAPDIGARDDEVKLITNGASVGQYKWTKSPWPSSGAGTHHYGGEADTFMATLAPADVNRADFGVSISAKLDEGAVSSDPAIDYVEIKVTFCE